MSDHIIIPSKTKWEKVKGEVKGFSPQVKQGLITASVTVLIALITAIGGYISVHIENSQLKAKVHDLELEVLPFRNLAVQQFNTADAASMKKLAEAMTALGSDYSNQLETINNLRQQIERLRKAKEARTVSKNARDALAFSLAGVPKGNVEIIMSDKDTECMAFGRAIQESLIAAGFPKVIFTPRDIFRIVEMFPELATSGTDLVFCVKNSASPPSCSMITLNCLMSGGIKASGWPYLEALSTNDFNIWVLPKPAHPDE